MTDRNETWADRRRRVKAVEQAAREQQRAIEANIDKSREASIMRPKPHQPIGEPLPAAPTHINSAYGLVGNPSKWTYGESIVRPPAPTVPSSLLMHSSVRGYETYDGSR
jgi:hypothetical protein